MWWAHNGLQIHDNDWDLNMAYFSNQVDEPDQPVPPVVAAPIQTSTVSVMAQTPPTMTDPVGVLPETAYKGSIKLTTSWSSPYLGSTRRSKHGQPKKPRRQMEFRAIRIHCPGDGNIIPVNRLEDRAVDSVPSIPKEI